MLQNVQGELRMNVMKHINAFKSIFERAFPTNAMVQWYLFSNTGPEGKGKTSSSALIVILFLLLRILKDSFKREAGI